MRYSPQTGHGTFNTTYTNPYNTTSGLRMVFDPASHPKNAGVGTTFEGLSVECLPNRPNASDSAASKAAKMRGVLCVYAGNDTGAGGAAGTHYSSEVMNLVQNVNSNSGNILELNHNFNSAPQDGGYSRTLFITGGGNVRNDASSAIEINHGLYGGGYAPYGTGILVRGSIDDYKAQRWAAGEGGNFLSLLDENASLVYHVDKNGYAVGPGVEATDTLQADHQFYAKPRVRSSLHACAAATEGEFAAVNDSSTNAWGATVTGGGTLHVFAYCDGATWTVMAR